MKHFRRNEPKTEHISWFLKYFICNHFILIKATRMNQVVFVLSFNALYHVCRFSKCNLIGVKSDLISSCGNLTESWMDRGKRPSKSIVGGNNKIYMDLKDIIREYTLPFLPAKSLFRFTGVCRDWKMQISTPFFAHNQSNSFHAVSGLFYQIAGEPPSFISLDPKAYGVPDPSLKFLPVPVDIRASCNGLLCCKARTGDKAYYMCNPATKMWKKLPKPDADHGTDPALVVIFEPSLLNFVADYKLVCAFPSTDFDDGYEFEIYSSAEGCWRISREICLGDRKLLPSPGVHVNGIVYWQMKHGVLVAFDLARERSQLIYGMKGALCVMQGKLCSVSMHGWTVTVNVLSNVYSNTMEMHSKARTWVQKRLINLDPSALGAGSCKQPSVVFADSDTVVIHDGTTIFSYDMKSKETSALGSAVGTRLIAYVNNLVHV